MKVLLDAPAALVEGVARTTWKGSMTVTASGSSSVAAVLNLVNPSIATTSTPSRQAWFRSGHGVTWRAFTAATPAPPLVRTGDLGDPTGQNRTVGVESLPAHFEPELVEAAERRQVSKRDYVWRSGSGYDTRSNDLRDTH